ncbi:MurR/RpiR family transcriptional regulator [Microvirga puerhi]|uniref:MurR/RpiR family transcriptional regulator n=1 Tax=Microvirga puerhi TaxID=2876078 RepID=A0ABS7VL29_9HYPH|nr:MurR/RpiR family transcriptional regulator [Microvirga puerhi]MBZ6075780.1 MurR/RpiR family transcriptional regulator [Microvirga puerhi]
MSDAPIAERLLAIFDDLPPQHQVAARWLLDHPHDVALLSMREQAKRVGVPPATMTRLAQRLGYDGFEELKEMYAASLRGHAEHFAGRTEKLLQRRALDGDAALTSDLLADLSGHLKLLSSATTLSAIARAADIVVERERLFCIGARSSFSSAHLAAYLLSLIGEQTVLADGAGSIGLDALRDIGPNDALLAMTIAPYTRVTVEAVAFARERGASIIAITDSNVSPIARQAKATIIVPTSTPSFLQTVAPALIVIECIAALVAARRGKKAVSAIAAAEDHLERFGSYYTDKTNKGRTS